MVNQKHSQLHHFTGSKVPQARIRSLELQQTDIYSFSISTFHIYTQARRRALNLLSQKLVIVRTFCVNKVRIMRYHCSPFALISHHGSTCLQTLEISKINFQFDSWFFSFDSIIWQCLLLFNFDILLIFFNFRVSYHNL